MIPPGALKSPPQPPPVPNFQRAPGVSEGPETASWMFDDGTGFFSGKNVYLKNGEETQKKL